MVALACLRAGAVLLPLNTAYTLAELEYFLGDAEPALTLCRPEWLEPVRALALKLGLRRVESLGAKRDGTFAEAIAAAPAAFETVPRASGDLAAILYTSGTTGRSKGAMLTHENLASNALTLIDCLALYLRRTGSFTRCRFFIPTGCSWRSMSRSSRGRR